MCDCFHLAFPNWQAASGTGAGRRLRAPEPGTEDDSTCDDPSQFTERPRPQGSSPVEEFPESEKYPDSDKECEAEHDPHHKSGSEKKSKRSGLGSMFEKRSTPKMSKLKEVHSPESGVMVKTSQDGCAEGLVYGRGGREGIFIKKVVPESPASKSMELKEGDQILSATVYFDNMPYEDAVQILEHAQVYKVKLCLKRKPDAAEAESAFESAVIPEEDVYAPEMREQGKSKRRGEARISWPKFPSFGKGRKSRFTRSHSSSEADEQRKLELSPTTSDTESPIKSQDALKGKKKHKIKLSGLTKRGRVSSSEDQDTDTPMSGQMLSPECLESPSDETPQVYVTEELKVVEDLRRDPKPTVPQTVQHKVELISIAGTLKTEDLTVALAGQESPSVIKSPDGKKKELSQLKINIMGKDKTHKKDAKAKSSPKRLKTLGASIEAADQTEKEKSDVIPSCESYTKLQDQLALDANTTQIDMSVTKVELEISDVALIQKSPQKGEEKTKKGKSIKQKQHPTFKLPKIGFCDIASEETMSKTYVNVEEGTTKIEQLTTEGGEVKEDPYERLSKSGLSRTKLPKREDIEIPGMEDMSKRTTAKRIKEPKTFFTGHHKDIQAETVQLLIDVDRVKEAVSKLPGFKLPKVDTSGMLIPEEITVIDANAQRISVKTPTKTKHDTHFHKFDVTASPEVSKATLKLPKITPADLASEELLVVTQVDVKPVKEYNAEPKQSHKEVYKREYILIPGRESAREVALLPTQETQGINSEYISAATFKTKRAKITMPSFEIAKPDITIPGIGIHLPKQNISEQNIDSIKGERTIFLQEEVKSKPETRNKIAGVVSGVQIPEIDGIEYIDSADDSPGKKDGGILLTGFRINLDADGPKVDVSCTDVGGKVKDFEAEKQTFKLPKVGAETPNISVNVPDANEDINIDGAKMTLEMENKGGKFKIPNLCISMPKVKGPKMDFRLSQEDIDVPLPEGKVKLPEAHASDISLGTRDVSNPEFKVKPLRTERDLDGHGDKFKMPEFGVKIPKIKGPEFDLSLTKKNVDFTLPQALAEKRPYVEHAEPGIKVESKAPEIAVYKQDVQGSPSKFKMPTFKLQTVGVGTPSVSVEVCDMEKDVKIDGANINRLAFTIEAPSVDIKGPSVDVKAIGTDHEGKEGKFKMPHLGFSMPKVKGPQLNLSSSKKDVDVSLPETSAKIKLPKDPKMYVSLGEADVLISEASVEVKKPDLEMKPLQSDVEIDGQGSKCKILTLGMSMPDMDEDVKIDGADIKFFDEGSAVDIVAPSIDIEGPSMAMKTTGAEQDGRGSKNKMPTLGFYLQKVTNVKLPETKVDVKLTEVDLSKVDVSLPEAKMEVKKPEMNLQFVQSEAEIDGQGGKFQMPKFGISMPKVKGPEFDFSSSKKDVDISLPDAKAEVNLPSVELKEYSAKVEITAPEIEAQISSVKESPSKFKLPTFKFPTFGATTPNVTTEAPDIDMHISVPHTVVDEPEVTAEVHLPEVHVKKPSVGVVIEQQQGVEVDAKLKKPRFSLPRFSFSKPSVKAPEVDASLQDVRVAIPEGTVEVKRGEVELPECEAEVEGSKFKMPKFGISMPKVTGPEIDVSLSKKDEDVTLTDAKSEMKLPNVEVKDHEVENKAPEIKIGTKVTQYERPTFKLPKFGVSTPSATIEVPDKNIKIEGADIKIPKKVLAVDIAAPSIDIEGPLIEREGKGSKFKLPSLGFSGPQIKGPDIDLSSSKKDVDVTLPEAKAEVKLPDVELKVYSAEVEIKAPGIDVQTSNVEGSPAKFKMPTFTLPKFGSATPKISVEVPDVDKDIKVDVTAPSIDTEGLSVDMKAKESELEVSGSKFKRPKFGISMPKVKGPEIDLSLSKKDAGVTLPEAIAEVQLPDVKIKQPSATVEIKAPEIEAQTGNVKGSPSKFQMPTFTLPKFGAATPKVSVEVPDVDKDIKVDVTAPSIDTEGLSVDMKAKESELEVSGSKFKMPKFGISMPKVKGPEIDLSLSKKDVDVTFPEAKANVKLPEGKVKESSAEVGITAPQIKIRTKGTEGSPSKFKMPTFTFPRFGVSTPSATSEVLDKDVNMDGADIKIHKEVLAVDIAVPSIDFEGPSIEREVKLSKFKLPSLDFSGPQIKGPDIDLSFSKKDVDVTLPEAKAEVQLPDVKIKRPSATVEIKGPEIEAQTGNVDGSPSKFKMPVFTLPKFGSATPKVNMDVPDGNKDIKVDVTAPSIDTEGLSVDVKAKGIELEVSGSKFKMPKFGISMPKVKGPEIDLSFSKKDVDVTIPESKAEVQIPDIKIKQPSATVEIKAPEIEAQTGNVKGSPSKFQMPTFTSPKFGAATPKVSVEVPDVDKDIKVDVTAPSIDTEGLSVDMKANESELEVSESKFKRPKFGISMPKVKGPEIDLSLSKTDVDVTFPEAKANVKLPEGKVKESSVEVGIKAPQIKIGTKGTEGSPSKFKMPTFKFPRFGVSTPSATSEVLDKDVKMDGGDIKIHKEVLAVDIAVPSIDIEGPSIEREVKLSKFKLPSLDFSGPRIKGPDIDLSLSKKDVDVTLPEAKADVKLPDVKLKESSAQVEIKAPEIDTQKSNVEESPAKFKMPTFTLPKFGSATPNINMDVPDGNKYIKVDVTAPSIDTEGLSVDMKAKGSELEVSGSKFKMPRFGISMPKVKGPEIDLSLSKKDVDVTLPETKTEVKLPSVEVKQPEMEVKPPEGNLELEGQESKFKMPKFGISKTKVKEPAIDLSFSKKDVDVTLPEAKAEVQLPDVKIKRPSATVEIKGPEIEAQTGNVEGSPSKFKMPTFTLPTFGAATPKVSVQVPDVDKYIKVDVTAPSIDTEGLSIDMKAKESKVEVSGSKFKMPKFGISMPKAKGPEMDLNLLKKDVDVTLPDAKAEVKLPDVKLKEYSAEVEIKAPEIKIGTKGTEGSPSKFKMPTFKLPRFGVSTPSATSEVPDKDVKMDGGDIKIHKEVLAVDIAVPSIDIEGPSIEREEKGSKFKLSSLGFSGPQIKGPDIDLSLSKKDVDVTLPEAKADVKLPDVKLKESSAQVEIKAPEIDTQKSNVEESPAKFKMPTFTLPKFGSATPNVNMDVPDGNKYIKVDVTAPSIDTEGLSVDMKAKGSELEVSGSKFKMPRFGISMPKVKGPEIDLSLSKKDVDVTLPETKTEVKLPSVEVKQPEMEVKPPEGNLELEGQESKFKMPKFGISKTKVKEPAIDLSFSKKDVDVTLPEAKAEVQLPDVKIKRPSATVEIKGPEIEAQTGNVEGSPSKFKMPTFTLPTFGAATPKVSVEVPDVDKYIKVDVTAPSIDTEGLSIDMKAKESKVEVSGSKFKMPKFGISMPKAKGPEMDLNLLKKDVDVTLPDAKAEVKLPDVKLKEYSAEVEIKASEIKIGTKGTEGSPSKFKMPTFKLPRFGVSTPSATSEVPDKDVKMDGGDIKIHKEVLSVDIAVPSIDIEGPSIEREEKGSKFKLSSLGFSGPQITGPDIDLSLSKKDVDVTLPEAKADVKLHDVKLKESSAQVEIKVPEIDSQKSNVEGSPAKFKMPTFTLPKFGSATPKVNMDVPDWNKDIKDTEGLSVDMKAKRSELEVSGSKFKMPKFGISMPKVKGPEIDLSFSKKDVDVTLPEAKAEVQLPDVKIKRPSATVEIKGPEIEAQTGNVDGSPSKFKMSVFTLPKFVAATPKVSVEVPDADKDIRVKVTAPSIDTEGLSVDMKAKESELEVSGSKFKMPKFGISIPKVKGPEIDLSPSKKDVDVPLPDAKADVKLPDVKLKESSAQVEIQAPQIKIETKGTEGSTSKFKMPTFKLPRFGVSTPSATSEVPDKDVKIDGAGIKIPKEVISVDIAAPSIDIEGPLIEREGKGSKFKLPSLGFSGPQIKGPDIDLGLSKNNVDVTLPEAKAEVKLPDVELKEHSAEVEIKAPGIDVQTSNVDGSAAKFKMPTFTLPKFGSATPKISVEVPDVDKDIKVDVTAPRNDTEGLSVDIKANESELEVSGSKFKMPKFGISMPKVKGPEIDLSFSKKDVDVTIPEAKAEVQLPDVKMKQQSTTVEMKAPEIEAQTGNIEGSPSKLKMPAFTLPKFGSATPKVNVELPDVDKVLRINGASVDVTADTEGLSVDMKAKESELEVSGSKFKMPNFGISMPKVKGPEIDLSFSKKDLDVTLPEAKAEVKLPSVEVRQPEAVISASDAPTVEIENKMKRPNWTFPKFSLSRTGDKAPDVSLETPKVDVTPTEAQAEAHGLSGQILIEESAKPDANLKKTKFSLPKFSFSKSSVKEPEVSAELPCVDVSLSEGQVIVKQPEMQIKAPELEAELDGQGTKFQFPKFGIALPKAKGPGEDLNTSQEDAGITLPEVKAKVKLPQIEVKGPSASVEIKVSETEDKSKDVRGSPLKFKMGTLKMPKFVRVAADDFAAEAADANGVAETDAAKLPEDVTVNIKGLSVGRKTDVSQAAITDSETPKTDTDAVEMKVEPKEESTSPKVTFTSFGEILKSVDVDFDVPKAPEHLDTSKEGHETDEPRGKSEARAKETKQEAVKSPERTGWFKFPRFGLSSPSEPAKDAKDAKSPVEATADEETSPTCSVQSSDAFADISSAMTSEHGGPSLSSPTKVTVKYSDPSAALGLKELHSHIITSTTRTERILVEPNLPEKVTILSSGASSSSEDTLRRESGRIHVITSNIQATPEARRAELLNAVQIQSAGGLSRGPGAHEAVSWTSEDSQGGDSQGGKKTVFERRFVSETSSERSESKETIVITKQITRRFESSEPVSGVTASSVQRLRDSVHSDKMRFFDGADE